MSTDRPFDKDDWLRAYQRRTRKPYVTKRDTRTEMRRQRRAVREAIAQATEPDPPSPQGGAQVAG